MSPVGHIPRSVARSRAVGCMVEALAITKAASGSVCSRWQGSVRLRFPGRFSWPSWLTRSRGLAVNWASSTFSCREPSRQSPAKGLCTLTQVSAAIDRSNWSTFPHRVSCVGRTVTTGQQRPAGTAYQGSGGVRAVMPNMSRNPTRATSCLLRSEGTPSTRVAPPGLCNAKGRTR
jgi:hypothetical protein